MFGRKTRAELAETKQKLNELNRKHSVKCKEVDQLSEKLTTVKNESAKKGSDLREARSLLGQFKESRIPTKELREKTKRFLELSS